VEKGFPPIGGPNNYGAQHGNRLGRRYIDMDTDTNGFPGGLGNCLNMGRALV